MKTSRRQFLSAAASTAAITQFPMLFSGCATKFRANETVQVAAIGAAGRAAADVWGLANAGARIVALCDVDTRRVGKLRENFAAAPFFTRYREMLDKTDKDVDAVMIGTPDHWHATMALECLGRGKHVLCEKPLCQSFHEMEAMLAAAKARPGLVNMAMNQGHAYDTIRDFREWIEAGLIGEATEAHVWCPCPYSFMDRLDELKQTQEIPKELDWEQWQGPVPHRAYNKLYLPGVWRFWTAYGCNTLGDWSCHLMDPVFWTFGFGLPESVETKIYGNWDPAVHGLTFPKGVRTTFHYLKRDGRPFKFVWYDGIACKDVPVPSAWRGDPKTFPPHDTPEVRKMRDGMANGAFVYGTRGVIEYGHHGANYLRLLPDTTLEKLGAEGGRPKFRYARLPGKNPDDKPFLEFVNAVKGGPAVGSDFAYAGAMTQCSLLGVAALFDPGKRLVFDKAKNAFSNSSAANKWLAQPRLAGW
ncbi:MAG: Gfo/Idh/MocA family oxidoreductase [Kiritimatiellae bacterium]|nr:Gfo/Idh/MocA family oxidoreductase [Kiritimatiellia bacterium]